MPSGGELKATLRPSGVYEDCEKARERKDRIEASPRRLWADGDRRSDSASPSRKEQREGADRREEMRIGDGGDGSKSERGQRES